MIEKVAHHARDARTATRLRSTICVSLLLGLPLASGAAQERVSRQDRTKRIDHLAASLRQDDPWPAIRRERIQKLLPAAMDAANVDAWVIFCRENLNDPLARHVGGEHAGRLTVFVFGRSPTGVESHVIAPATEAITLRERLPHARVIDGEAGRSPFELVARYLRERQPKAIAINKSELAAADGLTAKQFDQLTAALGPELAGRLTSSEELVFRWLGVKLPAEIEIMRQAAALTDLLAYEAFNVVVPGKTTNGQLAGALRSRVEALDLGHAWPDNPGIQSGLDRGRGNDARRVIVSGDIIDIDFGIKVYDMWCTDVQRFAYVLRAGETAPPDLVRHAWDSAKQSTRKMLAAMRPGVFGWEVDRVQVDWMASRGSLKHWAGTGHAVGYWAHDVGPSISGYRADGPPQGAGTRRLEPGMVFAFDGNYVWPAEDSGLKGTRSITLEEMAAVTATGAEYISPVQEELVLIPPGGLRGQSSGM